MELTQNPDKTNLFPVVQGDNPYSETLARHLRDTRREFLSI